jgi:hypothetical protein
VGDKVYVGVGEGVAVGIGVDIGVEVGVEPELGVTLIEGLGE